MNSEQKPIMNADKLVLEFYKLRDKRDNNLPDIDDMLVSPSIMIDPMIMGGLPCLRGHRIGVGQLIGELLDESESQINAVADNYDLDRHLLRDMYNEVARFFNHRYGRKKNPLVTEAPYLLEMCKRLLAAYSRILVSDELCVEAASLIVDAEGKNNED